MHNLLSDKSVIFFDVGYTIDYPASETGCLQTDLWDIKFAISKFGVKALYGRVMHGNDASVRVLEKNGYQFLEEEFGAEDDPCGKGMPVYVYKEKAMEAQKEIMNDFYKKNAGKYRLVKFVVGGNDCSEAYVKGWEDKSFYMFFEITEEGRFGMTAHTPMGEKEYEYVFDPMEMKYYVKADCSDGGIPITIENGVLTEKTPDHLMICERFE